MIEISALLNRDSSPSNHCFKFRHEDRNRASSSEYRCMDMLISVDRMR